MNKTKILLGIAALGIGTLGLLTSKQAMAYRGDYTQSGPNCTAERHEEMTAAFDNNDYGAWSELMSGKGRVTQIINESNFAQFAEAHRLGKEGKFDETDAIRADLNLRTRNGDRVGAAFKGNGEDRGGFGRTINE